MSKSTTDKKCKGTCKRKLVVSRCWPNDPSRGWAYLYCPGTKRCSMLSTTIQGVA